MNSINVFTYSETTAFLQDFKKHLEATTPAKATYDALAEELQLTSRTHARKIFRGDQKIPKKSIAALGAFGFLKDEVLYLELLRQFEQSKDAEQSIGLYKKALQLQKQKNQTSTQTLTDQQLKLLEQWFYIHILYYFDLMKGETTAEDIVLAFKGQLTKNDVNQGLEVLSEIGLVDPEANGVYTKKAGNISLLDHLPRPIVKKFHSMMIERSLKAVYELPFEKRFLMASTIPVTQAAIPLIEKRISDFVAQLDRDFSSPQADTLYQLNLQFFHVASRKNE